MNSSTLDHSLPSARALQKTRAAQAASPLARRICRGAALTASRSEPSTPLVRTSKAAAQSMPSSLQGPPRHDGEDGQHVRCPREPTFSQRVVVPAPGAARHAMRARARQLSGRGRPRPTSRTRPTSTMARPCAGRAAPLLQLRFASAAAAAARNHDRLRETTCVREQTHASDGWAALRCITHPLPYPSPRSARPTMTPAAAADRTRSEPRPPASDNLRA